MSSIRIDKCGDTNFCRPVKAKCVKVLTDGVFNPAKVTVSDGCIVEVEQADPFSIVVDPCADSGGGSSGGMASITTRNSTSVSLIGAGNSVNPLKAEVRVSSSSGNALVITANGLAVTPASAVSTTVSTQDSTSVLFTGNGAISTPLEAEVKLDPRGSNALEISSDGLFASPSALNLSTENGQLAVLDSQGRLDVRVFANNDPTKASIGISGLGTVDNPLKAEPFISAQVGNSISVNVDSDGNRGVYSPPEYARLSKSLINNELNGILFIDTESKAAMYIGEAVFTLDIAPVYPTPVIPQTSPPFSVYIQYSTSTTVLSYISSITNMALCKYNAVSSVVLPPNVNWESGFCMGDAAANFVVIGSDISATAATMFGYYISGVSSATPPTNINGMVYVTGTYLL